MGDRRSGRNRKIVNYAKLNTVNGDDDDDDFKCSPSPDKKRIKVEKGEPDKKKALPKNTKQPKVSDCKEKSLNSSQSLKRVPVEERVFERHVKQALVNSKSMSSAGQRVNSSLNSSESDHNSSESSLSEDDTNSEDDSDDDFAVESSNKAQICKIQLSESTKKIGAKSIDQLMVSKKEAISIVKYVKLKLPESEVSDKAKNNSSIELVSSPPVSKQKTCPVAVTENVETTDVETNKNVRRNSAAKSEIVESGINSQKYNSSFGFDSSSAEQKQEACPSVVNATVKASSNVETSTNVRRNSATKSEIAELGINAQKYNSCFELDSLPEHKEETCPSVVNENVKTSSNVETSINVKRNSVLPKSVKIQRTSVTSKETDEIKVSDLNENIPVTQCHSSPIRLPTKRIRIGLSRKVIKPLHVGVRKEL